MRSRKVNPEIAHTAFYIMFVSFIILCVMLLFATSESIKEGSLSPEIGFGAFSFFWVVMMISSFIFLDKVRVVK